jgi:hypothetical protein
VGASLCQGEAGTTQGVIVPRANAVASLDVPAQPGLPIRASALCPQPRWVEARGLFEFKMRAGVCVYRIVDDVGLVHRLTTLGSDGVQL